MKEAEKNNFIGKEKILITGVTGFVGANIARVLVNLGAKVYAIKKNDSDLWRLRGIFDEIKFYEADLSDKEKISSVLSDINPDIIIHLAVYGGYHYQQDLQRMFQVNLFGTINLLEAFLKTDGKLFINTGSSSEYGIKNKPMRETDYLEPVNDYGLSKAATTLFCQKTAKKTDRNIITIRLFSAYGYFEYPGRLFPSIIKPLLEDKIPNLANPSSVRDFCFIDDIVNAYLKIINSLGAKKLNGEIFNISSGRQYSVQYILNVICSIMGKRNECLWGKVASRESEPAFWQANIDKIKKTLGWEPTIDLNEGLKLYIEWFRKNKKELYEK